MNRRELIRGIGGALLGATSMAVGVKSASSKAPTSQDHRFIIRVDSRDSHVVKVLEQDHRNNGRSREWAQALNELGRTIDDNKRQLETLGISIKSSTNSTESPA